MEWINTNDKMPIPHEVVIFYSESGFVLAGFFCNIWHDAWYEFFYGNECHGVVDEKILFWMPLPQPPKDLKCSG